MTLRSNARGQKWQYIIGISTPLLSRGGRITGNPWVFSVLRHAASKGAINVNDPLRRPIQPLVRCAAAACSIKEAPPHTHTTHLHPGGGEQGSKSCLSTLSLSCALSLSRHFSRSRSISPSPARRVLSALLFRAFCLCVRSVDLALGHRDNQTSAISRTIWCPRRWRSSASSC